MPSTQQIATSPSEQSRTSVREAPLHTESMTDPLRSCTAKKDTDRPRQVATEPEDGTRSGVGADGSIDFLRNVRAARKKNDKKGCRHTPIVDGARPPPSDRSTTPPVRLEAWQKLIAVRKKLASVTKYTWDSTNMYAVEHSKGGASAETYGRYEKAYREIWTNADKAHTAATGAILKVSDGNGTPTAAASVIDKHTTAFRVPLAGLESDMDLVKVRGANHRSI